MLYWHQINWFQRLCSCNTHSSPLIHSSSRTNCQIQLIIMNMLLHCPVSYIYTEKLHKFVNIFDERKFFLLWRCFQITIKEQTSYVNAEKLNEVQTKLFLLYGCCFARFQEGFLFKLRCNESGLQMIHFCFCIRNCLKNHRCVKWKV